MVYTISGYTGSEQAVAKARSWLRTCIATHACSGTTIGQLPTRVLCIDGPEDVKLHISKGASAPYACLSHCWGPQPSLLLRTTMATLDQFQDGIPWCKLPKTFQDAIKFTSGLGLKYLWIDSLCIVQDSPADWRQEGSLMARIYESAQVTLAASISTSPDMGCFTVSRHAHLARSMKLIAQQGNDLYQEYTISFRTSESHFEGMHPLFRRGWVGEFLQI
jgi:hypothetical protein